MNNTFFQRIPSTHSPSPKSPKNGHLPLTALVAGAVAIGFAPIFVRLSPVGPSATAFWRLILALPPLWLWMSWEREGRGKHRPPSSRSDYLLLSLAGFFFAGDLSLWHWSVKLTSVANATLLVNFAPVFVTLGGWLIFSQSVRIIFVLGMGLALGGMTLIAGNSFRIGLQHFLGDSLSFTAALFYAGYLLSVKYLRDHFSTSTIMAWSGLISTVVLLPVTLISGESFQVENLHGWMILIGLALISHVGGQSLIAYALAHLPASFSSVGLLVQPVAAALLAWFLLNETIGGWQTLGGVLVLFGILVARRGSSG
jgi:drug/metabolite transporter (DMT)-like permease